MKFGRLFSWILIVGEIHCMTAVCKAHSEMRSMSLLGGSGGMPSQENFEGFKIEDLQVMSNYLPVDYIANLIINTL